MERHLAVEFGVTGVPIQHYRAEEWAAIQYAAEAIRQGLVAEVTVDMRSAEELKELPQLPYQRLFMQ